MESMKFRIQGTEEMYDLSQYDEHARDFINDHSDGFKGIAYDKAQDIFTITSDEYVFWLSAISNQRMVNSISGFLSERFGQDTINGILSDINASDMSWSDKLEAKIMALKEFNNNHPRY